MNNGEGFLVTDWSESIRRVQFHRKQTFDAGATPGLDDFERPELKSVSGNLVAELRDISDERERRESELADLRQELDKRDQRIRQLEKELEDARDMSRMADQFAQALMQRAEAPYRGGRGRNLNRPDEKQAALREYEGGRRNGSGDAERDAPEGDAVEETNGAEEPLGGETVACSTDEPVDASDEDEEFVDDWNDAVFEEGVRADEWDPLDSDDIGPKNRRDVVDKLTGTISELNEVSRRMLAYYRDVRVGEPVDAHVAAGASGDQQLAYSRNRPLRQAGFVRHVGRGQYGYYVPELIREEYADRLDPGEFGETVAAVEAAFVDAEDVAEEADEALGGEPEPEPDPEADPAPKSVSGARTEQNS
jgi:hypothetical protein